VDISAFPELTFSADTGEWQETEGGLLSFRTPQLSVFGDMGKKALYVLCVKVAHFLRESKWQDVFGSGASPKCCWRTLYKPPIEKRSGDLQWRTVHGIIATHRHRAHLDPQVGEGCPFCGVFFHQLEGDCQTYDFTPMIFIYGPKYSKCKLQAHVLLNLNLGNQNWLFGFHVKENYLFQD